MGSHFVTIVHSFYLLWPSSAWVIIFPHYLYQKWLLFSLNCNSVLLNTLAQAFWLDHYKKKPPLFTFPVISSASRRLYWCHCTVLILSKHITPFSSNKKLEQTSSNYITQFSDTYMHAYILHIKKCSSRHYCVSYCNVTVG